MSEIAVQVPDFASMPDEEIRQHPLAWRRDGRWSALSQYLRGKFDTDRMNINEAWAVTSQAWSCPACGRSKVEIARKTDAGVILCQLERHHDHLGDLVSSILRNVACKNVPEALLSQRKRACAAAIPLFERFAETLVCMDCNAADAAMKSDLGDYVHKDFSFSPSEIGGFVISAPNAPHGRDVERGRQIWSRADADFQGRLRFAEQMAQRLQDGLHDRETYNNLDFPHGDEDARLFLDLARDQVGARGNLPRLGAALLFRSCANDGHRSSRSRSSTGRVRVPTPAEYTAHDGLMQRPGPWREVGSNWKCACCSRTKFEIMRVSGSGKWTAQMQWINDYEVEQNPTSLRLRAIYRTDPPIFKALRQVAVCQDCRLILTDAGKLRAPGGGGDNALAPATIASLVGRAIPHTRHTVAEATLLCAIETDRQWSEAAADFWTHRTHAGEAALRMIQLVEGRGMTAVAARTKAIADLCAARQLPNWNASEVFDWLLAEDARLKA